jgi:S-adenosylmethionine/arginine decarboxylase-like enzyme
MPLHTQLLVNGYTNNAIKSETAAVEWMQSLVDSINMKTIQGPYASYVTKDGNRGLTCVVMIETSHIALHVWDEPFPAEIQFDLYTCGQLELDKVLSTFKETFDVDTLDYILFDRENGFKIEAEGKE